MGVEQDSRDTKRRNDGGVENVKLRGERGG